MPPPETTKPLSPAAAEADSAAAISAPLRRLGLLGRIVAARPRLFIGALVGIVMLFVLPRSWASHTRGIAAWDCGVFVYVALSLSLFLSDTPSEQMAAAAEAQEEGEWTIFAITVCVLLASIAAMAVLFSGLKDVAAEIRSAHVVLGAATLLLSWMMAHTTFAFRYAHEFYERDETSTREDGCAGGLEFPHEPHPLYADFMYFSLVLGMTFQVSDVQITSRKFRKLAALHGLISFLFNASIIAMTVNIAAGLV